MENHSKCMTKYMTSIFTILSIPIIVTAFFYISSNLYAASTIYIQNNTSLNFNLKINQTGSTVDRTNWRIHRETLPSWEPRTKVVTFNRNSGIKKGKFYIWEIKILTEKNEEIVSLQHKLIGTTFYSDMSVLVDSSMTMEIKDAKTKGALTANIDNWLHDHNIHEYELNIKGQIFILKYKIEKGANSDITYLLHEKQPFANNDISKGNKLFVLTYNTYGIFTQGDIKKRFKALPEAIEGLGGQDVVIFNEAFKDAPRNSLIKRLKKTYPYITPILDAPWYNKLLNGGIFMASRYKIEDSDQMIYKNCGFPDCLSAKGAQYIKINKNGYVYHVFATHINYDGHPEIRMKQLQELRAFIDSKKIPKDEAIVIGGDFNIDENRFPYEYQRMLDTVDCSSPTLDGYQYSNDSLKNYRAVSGDDNEGTQCRYDYVLAKKGHVDPLEASNEVRICKSSNNSIWDSWEISDHFPVQGIFTFPIKKGKDKEKVD